jgi:hypothetical protein
MPEDNPVSLSMNISADLTKTSELLVSDTSKGVSKLARLVLGKREADIIRHRILTAAQTRVDQQKILAGEVVYSNGQLLPVQRSLDALITESIQAREKDNLLAAMRLAAEKTATFTDEEVSDEPVDETWFLRWRREAAAVSREDLCSLLAGLLAENIRQPETVSLRTLDVAKNLTAQDCQDFTKIAPFIFNGSLVPAMGQIQIEYPPDITLDLLFRLNEAGLLADSNLIGMQFLLSVFNYDDKEWGWGVLPNNLALLFVPYDANIQGVALTQAGKEILRVTDVPPLSAKQREWVAECLLSNGGVREVRAVTMDDQGRITGEILARNGKPKRV